MCDLIRNVIIAVFEAAIPVKSTHVIGWKPEKNKYGNERIFYINLHLKDRLDIEFTAF